MSYRSFRAITLKNEGETMRQEEGTVGSGTRETNGREWI